jgi:hypothetical protein
VLAAPKDRESSGNDSFVWINTNCSSVPSRAFAVPIIVVGPPVAINEACHGAFHPGVKSLGSREITPGEG